MNDTTGVAAIVVALITAGVTMWTQRGGARAQRRTAVIEERALGLEEFKILREAAMHDLSVMRDEVAVLRSDVSDARDTLAVASTHIRTQASMIPDPPGPPDLPDLLKQKHIGV